MQRIIFDKILICWQCFSGHDNHMYYKYDDYYGTVQEVVHGNLLDPSFIDDNPCITCREQGFYKVTYELQRSMDTNQ